MVVTEHHLIGRMILTEKGVAEIGIGTVIDMIADVVAQGAGLVIEEVVAEDIDRDHEIVIDTLNPTGDQDPEIEKEEDALGHIREKEVTGDVLGPGRARNVKRRQIIQVTVAQGQSKKEKCHRFKKAIK